MYLDQRENTCRWSNRISSNNSPVPKYIIYVKTPLKPAVLKWPYHRQDHNYYQENNGDFIEEAVPDM